MVTKITGVKAIIKSPDHPDKYLIAKHNNKLKQWTFLGGMIDEGDISYESALKRELKEELNLDIEIEKEIGNFVYESKMRMYLVFLAIAKGEPSIVSKEILEINWFSYKELKEMNNKNLLQTGFEIEAFERYFES